MKSSKLRRRRLLLTITTTLTLANICGVTVSGQESLQSVWLQTENLDMPFDDVIGDEVVRNTITASSQEQLDDTLPVGFCEPVLGQPAYADKCAPKPCCDAKKKEAAMDKMKNAYGGVFYANDFSYLKDPCYDGPACWTDPLKGMFGGKLDIGGETRYRYHSERNHRGLGLTGRDDDFWLTRQRLFANYRATEDIRVFGEMLHADSQGEEFAPRPIEENHADIQNLFVDVKLFDGDAGKMVARVGRQELLIGQQRLVSPLDWANTRRTFDGVRGIYTNGDFSLDTFWTQPVVVDRDEIDRADENEDFFGAYAIQKNTAVGDVGLYYLGYNSENVNANRALNRNFTHHTVGSSVFGATDNGTLYDFEGAFQFGDSNTADTHLAGFFTAGLGRKLEIGTFKSTLWGYYDYASGEEDFNEVSVGDGGFDHLFPLAHKYNGFMDLFGRRNLHDLNVLSITPISKKVSFLMWFHQFYLVEDTTPYSVVLTPYNTTTPAADRDLGQEIDLLVNVNLDARNNVLFGYSHFNSGQYYEETPNVAFSGDADFFYFQYQTQY